ncbi:hypothetical protein OS493_022373 [Desmophyllum pertusum]|uniref:Uncharacterized protein n=1 Tax=Desmophyllum pertusum TaxID=174260 RepID=A0A9X0A0X5_9CNID|nr:hypothetical protein OS493_022373 [Desmophyllum pertusum]
MDQLYNKDDSYHWGTAFWISGSISGYYYRIRISLQGTTNTLLVFDFLEIK